MTRIQGLTERQIVEHYYDELCAALTMYEAEGGTLQELYADIVEIVCEMDEDYDF